MELFSDDAQDQNRIDELKKEENLGPLSHWLEDSQNEDLGPFSHWSED